MSEFDDLERDLLAAADVWFDKHLHLKLQRLIAIARDGERWKQIAMEFIARMPISRSSRRCRTIRLTSRRRRERRRAAEPQRLSSSNICEPADMHGNGE